MTYKLVSNSNTLIGNINIEIRPLTGEFVKFNFKNYKIIGIVHDNGLIELIVKHV
ncbi:MAG: hypothetical protein ACJASQ_003070 [Crocinitomicaceae bacterium]|jgi:hypothetical protein